jgi:hypothetical protein
MVCFWITAIEILNSVSALVGGRSFLLACINFIHFGYVLWLSISCCSLPSVLYSWFSVYMRLAARIGLRRLPAGTWGPQTPPEEKHWPLLAYVAVQNVAEPCPPPVFWYCNLDFNISLKSVSDIYSRYLWTGKLHNYVLPSKIDLLPQCNQKWTFRSEENRVTISQLLPQSLEILFPICLCQCL